MIESRAEYYEYLKRDADANYRASVKPSLFGDEVWKFLVHMRKRAYHESYTPVKRVLCIIPIILNKYLLRRYALKCGFTIPYYTCGKGLALPHRGTIVINTTAQIGENCRIHEGVTIGSTNGSKVAAKIGNNVFIGSGAKIIGDISIADDVSIGANAVVVKSIEEPGTTWGGGTRS